MATANKKISHSYGVLGLSKADAVTPETLKASYKKAAREWHPDLNTHRLEEAHERFSEIQKAYNALLFLLQKEGGDLPPGVLNAHEFFNHFGHDHLAEMTEETLEEISLSRAAMGLGHAGDGASTVGALDGKLMQKLKMWSCGPEYKTSVKILDTDGHFTDQAVRNILEFAMVYERADTEQKRKKVFGVHDVESNETDPYDVRLSQIIRQWVYDTYVRTARMGWIHKSRAKYLVAALSSEVRQLFQALSVAGAETVRVIDLLASSRFDDAASVVDSILSDLVVDEEDSPGDARRKPGGAREIKALASELDKIASKVKIKVGALASAARDEAAREENILLDAFADRILAIEARVKEIAPVVKVKGKATAPGADLALAVRTLRGLADDVRALSRIPDASY